MAKGKASSHALKNITHQLAVTIGAWQGQQTFKRWAIGANHELPPFYQIAALRGDGILLSRFFGSVLQQTRMDINPVDWLSFWQDSVVNGGFLMDLLSRIGWLQVLAASSDIPELTPHTARQYYCILLDALAQHHPHLLDNAVDDYFLHLWRQRFPVQAITSKTQTASEQLRHKLTVQLRQLHKKPVEVKESFIEQEQQIVFSLKFRCQEYELWQTLLTLERPRLKAARIAAYEQALHNIKMGTI